MSLNLSSANPLPTPPAAQAAPPLQYRKFGDAAATRGLIYNNVLTAAQQLEPISNERHTLRLTNVAYKDPAEYDTRARTKAILTGQSLDRRLHGTWELLDNTTGQPIASRDLVVARVPYLTDDGTFVNRGNEYGMAHQLRLRAGAFARQKQNGELEAHMNMLPGKGTSHHLYLEPKSGNFKINIRQAHIPLAPLLKALGASDNQLREVWGNELFQANVAKDDNVALRKLYERVVRKREPHAGNEVMRQAVADAFNKMELDPEVTRRTLKGDFRSPNLDAMLAATKKLIALNRGEDVPDDRDSLAYQTLYGPEDLIAERVQRDRQSLRQALWKATAKGNLDALPSGLFTPAITAALIGSGLASPLEEINPAEILDQQTRVTRMGEGGIPSLDSVPEESRSVQPSYFGFIDFLRTPECYDRQTEVMTRRGWLFWPDINEDDEFACLIDGHLTYAKATQQIRQHYIGTMYGAATGRVAYLVTPNHRLWVSPQFKGAQYRIETAEECHGRFRRVCSGGFAAYAGDGATTFNIPQVERRSNNEAVVESVPIGPWAELIGWWLGEGNCRYVEEKTSYYIKISQSETANPENCDRIATTLRELPFAWSYSDRAFILATKQLAAYFQQFGGSESRFIPELLFRAPLYARQRLYDALLRGEGRRNRQQERTQFCSTSERLADDFCRLAFGLGIATRKVYEPDDRPQSNHGGAWVVHVHKQNEHQLLPRSNRGNDYYTTAFDDEVFCATVPGGLLYVRRGDTVGHWSGNSGKVGVDARLARGAVKGSDGRLYTQVKDLRTGQLVYKSPQDLADETITFPGQEDDLPMHVGLVNGRMEYVERKQARYELPQMENAFSPLANMIPLKFMTQGQRVVMGSRMLTQALPLTTPEAPLVQAGIPNDGNRSFEEEYGRHMGAVRADKPARVVRVDGDGIELVHQDGTRRTVHLRNNMPLNRKTFWHQEPSVKPGDVVQPGQLLARSNFTDAAGTTALGKNLRVAYIPFHGHNFEDAIVVSASAAKKKLVSEHMYQHELEWTDRHRRGKHAFMSVFPAAHSRQELQQFDDDGIIKVGTEVKSGDPLILAVQERERGYGQVHRGRGPSFVDDSVNWDHHLPGVVTHVEKTDAGPVVVVKSKAELDVGDKLSGRYGDKGVVSRIVPDDEMPTDRAGRPYEILVNPLGIGSRGNPGQIVEAALGKIAALTGKPYKVADFNTKDEMLEFAAQELRKHNLTSREDIIDQETGRKIPGIKTGVRFFMKLHHTSESKGQGRALGGYTADGMPAKGGVEGAKRVGMLDLGALLSHGATSNIRDIKLVRGQADPRRWAQFMAGFNPPEPQVPYTYQKFVNYLRAGGINPVRDGTRTHIMALTDKAIDELTGNRELQNTETVNWKDGLKPKAGGLFDEKLTGGHNGNLWAKITLHEPLPNPVMEEPARRVLGLTENKFRDVLAGRADINGRRGPTAIAQALASINVDDAIRQARADISGGKKSKRDMAVRRLRYLKDTQRLGIHPGEWMLTKVPVLPPMFRPVTTMGNKKLPLVADANYLYKELFDANRSLRDLTGQVEDTGDERLAVYDALKGVVGLGAPTQPKNVERNVKGVLKHIFGGSPKFGMVQRKLLSTTTDLVGRAVITPNPDFDMDTVGLPEEKAWEIYTPFIVRNLTRRGMPRLAAANAVKGRTDEAKQALLKTMEERPIIINRAPVLHRYGMMAFWPRLVKGHTMQVSPLVVGGFNADFDGDAMQYHVPSTDDAAEEAAAKMLPSKNLFSAAKFNKPQYQPSHEYVGGLYAASARINKHTKPRVFRSEADASRAYYRGDIGIDQEVEILDS